MAEEKQNGHWVTLDNGVHLFIGKGQTIDDALEKLDKKGKTEKKSEVISKAEQEEKDYENLSAKEYGEKYSKKEEQPKEKEETESKVYKIEGFENNQEIDWDIAETNEKVNKDKAKNPKRTDKYGNPLLSDEAFNVGYEAGKSYLDYMTKYNEYSKLKKSNQFLGGIQEIIGNAITNNGYDPNQDITYTDYNQIIGSILGEEVDTEAYELNRSNGFTGRKYIDYIPKSKEKNSNEISFDIKEEDVKGTDTLNSLATRYMKQKYPNVKTSMDRYFRNVYEVNGNKYIISKDATFKNLKLEKI